jgi:large subunit ribosomal protein L9
MAQQVKLILREDVPNLGQAGDVVTVRPGYARNYLLPQGKAMPATEGRIAEVEHHRRVVAERMERERRSQEAQRDRIQGVSLRVEVLAGEEGKLFGSVTAAQIAELLAAKGVEVDRRKIELAEPIKQVGEHEISVRLFRDVIAKVKLEVAAANQPGAPAGEPAPAPAADE